MTDAHPPEGPQPTPKPHLAPFGGVLTETSDDTSPEAPPTPSQNVDEQTAGGRPPTPNRRDRPPENVDEEADVATREMAVAAMAEATRRAQLEDAGVPPDLLPEVPTGDAPLEPAERRTADGRPTTPAGSGRPSETFEEDDVIVVDLVEAERLEAEELELEAAALGDPERPNRGPIDPRIRERRVAVTRAEGRRRLRILLTVVSVASAIGIAWLIVQSPLLAVDTITVKGTARESQSAVAAAAGVHKGTALLFVDTGDVARRVEALPWVAKATVDRELPNGLTITVIERAPVAWVRAPVAKAAPKGTLGVPVLIDRFGRVLGDSPEPPAGLPELVGITDLPERGGRIKPATPAAAIALLPDALRAQTGSVIKRDGQAVLKLIPLPGTTRPIAGEVRLGSFDQIAAKGAAALAVIDQLALGREHVRYVDVRVPGAPATG
jgi:cell division protein FtsQ